MYRDGRPVRMTLMINLDRLRAEVKPDPINRHVLMVAAFNELLEGPVPALVVDGGVITEPRAILAALEG